MIRLILLTDFTEAFAHKLLKGILTYSTEHEPWVVCKMPPSYKEKFGIEGVIEWAKNWKAHAIIGQFDDTDDVTLFRKNGIVALAQDFKSLFSEIPNITSRYHETGRMAADFFLQKGFRNFAFYGYENVVWSEGRCAGFRDRVAEAGFGTRYFENQTQPIESLWYYDVSSVSEWLLSLPRPVALMTCDDNVANKIMEICRVQGIRIPEEIAVLGVDNDEITCNLSDPPLSSVECNVSRAGYEAAVLIQRLLDDPSSGCEDIYIEPTTIVGRLSTDIFATADPAILAALKYIHVNLSNKLLVSDIVKQVPLSRRLLEIRFKAVTGWSVYRYIMNHRMDRFCQLLLSDETAPIAELAQQAGLSDANNLSRMFRAYKNCTPMEYRANNRSSR